MSAYGAALLGGAMNIMGGVVNNAWAQHREDVAREDNYYLNELAAEKADKRTRALYYDLQSPKAILKQIQDAGLSPALMYGGNMGGSVGQGAMGAGASGISPTTYGIDALQGAQVALMQAQTEKTQEETKNIATNTNKQNAEIDKLVEETKNEQLKQVYQELNNTLTQMDVNLKGNYAEDQIKADLAKTYAETNNLIATLESLKAKGKIDKESADAIITYNRNRLIEQQADILLKQMQAQLTSANITLTKAQVQKLLSDIAVNSNTIDVSRRQIKVNEESLKEQVKQWCKANNLRQQEIDVQVAKITSEFILGMGANGIRAIDALIPF